MKLVGITITDQHRAHASELCATRPTYRGSHRGPHANEVGFLGEAVTIDHLAGNGLPITVDDTTTHDLRLPTGQTIDIKTKDRTVTPQPGYECSVPLYNHDHQQPDYYLFVSLQRDRNTPTSLQAFHTAHLLGAVSFRQLEGRGQHRPAGWTDPTNGTTFWTTAINIQIRQLVPLPIAIPRWLADHHTPSG